MPHFIPDLDDPRTHGWGGREYSSDKSAAWTMLLILLPVAILFAIPVASVSGFAHYFIPCVGLALCAFAIHDICTTHGVDSKPRAPAIVCDPQGLTVYTDRGRICEQWCWQDIDSVSAHIDYLRISHLRIIPRSEAPQTFRDFHDYRFNEIHIYTEIAAVATDFLHGTPPPAPSALPAYFSHIWSETQPAIVWTSIGHLLLLLLALAVCWPGIAQHLYDIFPAKKVHDMLEKSIAIAPLAGFLILAILITYYRNYILHKGACRQITINASGLHFLKATDDDIIGNPLTLYWTDITHIEPCIEEQKDDNGDISRRYYLRIRDRLSNHYKMDVGYLPDVENSSKKIAAAVDAVIHSRPSPPLTAENEPTFPTTIPLMTIRLFWINVLLTTVTTLGIGSCLYLHRCLTFPSDKILHILACACITLTCVTFFIEVDYYQNKRR